MVKRLLGALRTGPQDPLGEATSHILHSIQSDSSTFKYSTQADREEAVHMYMGTSHNLSCSPNSAIKLANINSAPAKKRAHVVDPAVVSRKPARRAMHGVDNAQRDNERSQQQLEADAGGG